MSRNNSRGLGRLLTLDEKPVDRLCISDAGQRHRRQATRRRLASGLDRPVARRGHDQFGLALNNAIIEIGVVNTGVQSRRARPVPPPGRTDGQETRPRCGVRGLTSPSTGTWRGT